MSPIYWAYAVFEVGRLLLISASRGVVKVGVFFCFQGDCGDRIWEVGKDDQVTIINVFGRGERAGMSIYNVLSTDQSAKSTESNNQARCANFGGLRWSDFLH